MSPAAPSGIPPSPPHLGRVRDFWRRVSEGRDIDDLWSKFAADARPLWAMMNKLTPARHFRSSRYSVGNYYEGFYPLSGVDRNWTERLPVGLVRSAAHPGAD